MRNYILGITMIISITLNLLALGRIGDDEIALTNLKLKNLQLVQDKVDAVEYISSQCRALIQACNKE